MAYQRAPRTSSPVFPSRGGTRLSPRPFPGEERPDAEAEDFRQRKHEAASLQDRERAGGITSDEQERLGTLRTEMDGFWAGRMDQAARFGHNVTAPAAASGQGVIQARWIYVEGSGKPGQYYWEGRGAPSGSPPGGGAVVPAPALQHMEDTHQGHSGGSMKSLRTDADHPFVDLYNLAHLATQQAAGKGLFYPGPVDIRGLGPRPVQTSIPHRDPSEHASIFGRMTGGERSSTQYQASLGTAEPKTSYQILHGMGHGEGGKQTQSPHNLASASEGANTEMIPFDKAISGNPDVLVDTHFRMRPGTHRAESVHQSFAHKDFPGDPFHSRDIDGDRPRPTRSEYEGWEKEASRFSDPKTLDAAASMIHLSHQPPRQDQSVWGRLGQWAPGSHPLDPRNSAHRDDDDDMMT